VNDIVHEPTVPQAVIDLEALEERWAFVVDWVFRATTAAYHLRKRGYTVSALEHADNIRYQMHVIVDQRFSDRLETIDQTEQAFYDAYQAVKATLDHEAIIAHSHVSYDEKQGIARKEADRRLQQRLTNINQRLDSRNLDHKKQNAEDEDLAARRESAEEANRDGSVSETDWSTQVVDQGAGD
jgi:flavin-dependent dehydrogenase